MVLGSGCDFLQGKHAREATTRSTTGHTRVVLRTHQATRVHKRRLFMEQATTELRKVLFTFEHNDQLCRTDVIVFEDRVLEMGPHCVSLHFRRRKSAPRTAFWDPFPAGKLRRQQSSLFRLFFWINVQESQHALKCEILA